MDLEKKRSLGVGSFHILSTYEILHRRIFISYDLEDIFKVAEHLKTKKLKTIFQTFFGNSRSLEI